MTTQQETLAKLDAQWKAGMVELADAMLQQRDYGRKAAILEEQLAAIKAEYKKISETAPVEVIDSPEVEVSKPKAVPASKK